ncbi:lsorbosone dehydrogenase [Mucor ambiguus]|uniref:Lsorbosone dehydrogenase n=1 Tax=Mucor ambiguus TaxID=91626 RepID=A0A0C9M3B0_9FUNG|nr:lsorbosone dehydrogenase [Mucor ambiguus]
MHKDTESALSEEDIAAAEEERFTANALKIGALRVGPDNVLLPDASAEHPLIISNPEDQPLCKPDVEIHPSRSIKVMEGYEVLVLTDAITNPRKMMIDPANHVLVVSPENGVYSIRMDKCGNSNVQLIVSNDQMDQPAAQGLALYDHHLFVSTANSVYKFPYSDGQHSPTENGVKVLTNINPDNANATPDVAIDPFGHAFVPRSVADIHDKVDPSQAIIKKFNFKLIPEHGFDYNTDGEVQAYGTNTYGSMGFDAQARLWGINGAPKSEIRRSDISADHDIAATGLAEELNLYEFPETNYGFPYCMTEFDFKDMSASAKGLGAQWAHPTFMNDSLSLDDYCQVESNNMRPSVPLKPNTIATSVHFYMGEFCSVGDLSTQGSSVGLPCNWTDTPILANHGATGHSAGHNVVRLYFDDLGHKPRWDKEPEVILEESEPCDEEGCITPFGLTVDKYGRLLISSDTTNEVFMVSRIYNQEAVKMLTDRANAEDDKDDKDDDKDDKDDDKDDKDDDKDDKDDDKDESEEED